MQVLQVRMYSLKPFPDTVRSTFELPSWPYFNGVGNPPKQDFVDYMKSLSIVRYLDDYPKFPYAFLFEYPEFTVNGMQPTMMYLNMCAIDEDNFKIIQWRGGRPTLRKAIEEQTGDSFAWYDWNKPVEVLEMSDTRVRCAPELAIPNMKGVRRV